MISGRIFSLERILSRRAFSTFRTLPNIGRIAWKRRSRPCLRRATGRVALDDVDLAPGRVSLLAVGELARERHALERALAEHEVAGLAGRLARAGGREALLDDPPAVAGVLVEVLADGIPERGLDLALDLGVAELRLRLTLELGLGQLHADDRGEALADVVSREVAVGILEDTGPAGPIVQGARQRGTEARDVGPAVDRVDVVREREHVLRVGVVVLERDLDSRRPIAASRSRSAGC